MAARAEARTWRHPDRGFLDPIVEGAWDSVVERHRAGRTRAPRQSRSGYAQNTSRQGAAVGLFHCTILRVAVQRLIQANHRS